MYKDHKKIFIYILLFSCTLLSYCKDSFAMSKRVEKQSEIVRVVIANTSSIELKINYPFELIDEISGKVVLKRRNFNQKIICSSGIIHVGKKIYPKKLFFKMKKNKLFSINGRLFRGDLKLFERNNKILAINLLPLEDYMKSVIPSEISSKWAYEALKAQAIAARTFTYYHMITNKKRDFDVYLNLQQYKGVASETPRTSWAVDVTFGQCLFYNSKIFPAYFHAVCGGYTEEASAVWETSIGLPHPARCTFCSNSAYFPWKQIFTKNAVLKKFNNAGYKWKSISDISPGKKASFYPRTRTVIISADGKKTEFTANKFRQILGYNKIKSSIFSIKKTSSTYEFTGRGWGHGVGLCQYGAKTLAEQGKSAEFILQYYYPSSVIRRIY